MKYCFPILILFCLLASQGCQWLTQLDEDRDTEIAKIDDRKCNERGYTWPGKAYVDCRRFLADDRQRERWMDLQMARQQQEPRAGIRPQSPLASYMPIDEESFDCFRAGEGADAYIECGEGRER